MNLEEYIYKIKEQLDIVAYIQTLLPLKKAGRNWVGLCPFHVEKTPSFTVSAEKGIFYCFGCHAGGDLIAFTQQFEHLDFREAVDFLGEKAGLPPLQWGLSSSQSPDTKNIIQEMLRFALQYYQQNLGKCSQAKAYLANRNIQSSSIDLFQLGYASPYDDQFIKSLQEKGFDLQMGAHLGLILKDSQGQYFPYFRDRILFPIFSAQGFLLGFGGRALGENTHPKYLNSPEHSYFHKGKHLFGLNVAKNKLKIGDSLVIVEGYMDVVALYQNGIENVCASLGTAFSSEQAKLASKHASQLMFCYDNDHAGVQATLRALDIVIPIQINCKAMSLPDPYKDPDDFIQHASREEWLKLCQNALMPLDYIWLKLWENTKKTDPYAVDQAISQLLAKLTQMPHLSQVEDILKRIALDTQLSLRVLNDRLQRIQGGSLRQNHRKIISRPRAGSFIPSEEGERVILKSLLESTNPDFQEMIVSRIDASDFASEQHQKLFQYLKEEFKKNGYLLNKEILIRLADKELIRLVSELFLIDDSFYNDTAVLECVLKTEENKTKKQKIIHLSQQIILAEKSGDLELSKQLREELKRIV